MGERIGGEEVDRTGTPGVGGWTLGCGERRAGWEIGLERIVRGAIGLGSLSWLWLVMCGLAWCGHWCSRPRRRWRSRWIGDGGGRCWRVFVPPPADLHVLLYSTCLLIKYDMASSIQYILYWNLECDAINMHLPVARSPLSVSRFSAAHSAHGRWHMCSSSSSSFVDIAVSRGSWSITLRQASHTRLIVYR